MTIKQNGGVFGRNPTFNDVTIEGDLIINGEVFTGLDFQGSWNASTNSPTLASSTGTNGEFYIVSVAGSTDLNGITNWGIGDWAIFNGTVWQRVEGGADGNFDDLTANSLVLDRSGNGTIAEFQKDGAFFGSVSVSGRMIIHGGNGSSGSGWYYGSNVLLPVNYAGALTDNALDLGSFTYRFDDIYASNGTIQTSDRNEKQDIEELSDAEQRVAVACKGLLRKFRWKDSVAEKGDDARTHFGIIAQDLQVAFEAEGLDASDYAMFISSTWTDEETSEEKTRMGVRYSELLAFIISAI